MQHHSEQPPDPPAPVPDTGAGAPVHGSFWAGLRWWEAALWAAGFGVVFWTAVHSLANIGD